jgi:hypothetical protein
MARARAACGFTGVSRRARFRKRGEPAVTAAAARAAIEQAAVAPLDALLKLEPAALCADFVPSVAESWFAATRLESLAKRASRAIPLQNLTHVGASLSAAELAHAIDDPRAPMPSFRRLPATRFRALVRFLSLLR